MSLPRSPSRRRVVEDVSRNRPVLIDVRVIFARDPFEGATYLEEDGLEERKREYERGDFEFVYARAEADVEIESIGQILTSAGLYGIESDSEQEYLDEIVARQWSDLRDVLKSVGVPTAELPIEVDPTWVEWRM
jgi:hypothetical protein